MGFELVAAFAAIGLFLGMLLLAEVGRRIGIARLARHPGSAASATGAAEGAVFALLGLLLAFTFSGAASRFEARRHLIAEEANAIGTAYLRIDLLPPEAQPELRQLFRSYLDTRIATYRNVADAAAVREKLAQAASLQQRIWAAAIAGYRQDPRGDVARVLLPALNDMIDITTTQVVATENHPPLIIFLLLAALSLASALMVGHIMTDAKERSLFDLLLLTAMVSLTFYVILDMEFPRLGLIRIDAADQVLIDLRNSLG